MAADKTENPQPLLSDSIADLIVEALGLAALSDAVITPLGGGITNRNYRIAVKGEEFVLRLGGKGADLLGINRKHEHAASTVAANLGIGAEVIFSDASADLLLTRFIHGQEMTLDMAAQPDTLQRIAISIRCYHDGPDFSGIFSPFEVVRSYHNLAIKHGVSFPPTVQKALEVMGRIEQALGPLEHLRPCHNDLLAANFIDDGQRIRLIDWEYAAMGDPFFDLGNFAVNQELSEESCRQLLQFYFGDLKPQYLARLHLMRLASDLRESFWGFLQSGISTLEFDFREYAIKHLERFLRNTADPQFPYFLRQCRLKG